MCKEVRAFKSFNNIGKDKCVDRPTTTGAGKTAAPRTTAAAELMTTTTTTTTPTMTTTVTSTTMQTSTTTATGTTTATSTTSSTPKPVTLTFASLDYDATDLAALEASIRSTLQDNSIAGFATMPIQFARGSIIATPFLHTQADAATLRGKLTQIQETEVRAFMTTTTSTTTTTATTTTDSTTTTMASTTTRTTANTAPITGTPSTPAPRTTGTGPITLTFASLDYDATDLAALEASTRSTLQENGIAGFATMPIQYHYFAHRCEPTCIETARASIIATLLPTTQADVATLRGKLTQIQEMVVRAFVTTMTSTTTTTATTTTDSTTTTMTSTTTRTTTTTATTTTYTSTATATSTTTQTSITAAAGEVQALRDQVKALEAALAAEVAAKDAALGRVALLEAENQALRGESTGGWSLTTRGASGGRLGPV